MKKRYLIFTFIFIVICLLNFSTKVKAADLDQILDYVVIVDPRMNDGSLDITYEFTWQVLDSTSEGPLTWVQIGTANEYYDTLEAKSDTIKAISASGSYVKIIFDRAYNAGEVIKFKYSLHQKYMHKISFGKCVYEFTPAWFNETRINNITVKWNRNSVKSSNSNNKEDNYLIWTKKHLSKGEKITAKVKYNKSVFSALSTTKAKTSNNNTTSYTVARVLVLIMIISLSSAVRFGGGGYYGHSGFYGGGHYGSYHSSCAHSSCACAHSSCASSCACACAGSGRAGCSKKDFYGTNLNTIKIKKAMKE